MRQWLRLPPEAPLDWVNLDLFAPVEDVEAAVAQVAQAFLTVITADRHCVVSGPEAACARVLALLGGAVSGPLPVTLAAHGPFAEALRGPLVAALARHAPKAVPKARLYHGANAAPAVLDAQALATAYADAVLGRLDLRPLLGRVYQDGARIFVDVGPRAALAPAIAATLDHPDVTVVTPGRGGPDALLRLAEAAAGLFAAGVTLDMAGLGARLARLRGGLDETGAEGAAAPVLSLPTHLPPVRPPKDWPPRPVSTPATAEVLPQPPIPVAMPRPFQKAAARTALPVAEALQILPHAPDLAAASALPSPTPPARETTAATPPAPRRQSTSNRPRPPLRALDWRPPSGPSYDRAALETLAGGRISSVFGPRFAEQDAHARQCRMPQPPLLLVDRVLGIEAEPGSMGRGICWTETDVVEGAWYLDGEAMPFGIVIEAGQADLLLISWLGCDFLNRGERVYRLLGCEVTFHGGPLPTVGDTLRFQIHIDGHARLGDTRLFFFSYDSRIGERLVSSVREGQAGFFSESELAGSDGVLWTPEDHTSHPGAQVDPTPNASTKRAFSEAEIAAFAAGDPYTCFGPGFERAAAHTATPRIAGARMRLIDRISAFEPKGGPLGRGYLCAEADVPTDAWFYDGHFLNDPCMPGTLMAEAAVQALMTLIAALGLTLECDGWRFRPVAGEAFRFSCRGQVVPDRAHRITYEVFVEEIHAGPEPTVYAALLARSDGFKVFLCERIGLQLTPAWPLPPRTGASPRIVSPVGDVPGDHEALMACALGPPGDAFGSMYRALDAPGRKAPRLPAPPYHFVSHILSLDCPPGVPTPGGRLCSACEVDPDAWYFKDGGTGTMPFSVLTEVLLQPCGWLGSYMGFALAGDVRFRNLDGDGLHILREIGPEAGTLEIEVTFLRHATAGTTTIVFYDLLCRLHGETAATLKTAFGFFPPAALTQQKGLPVKEAERTALDTLPPPPGPGLGTDAPATPSGRLAMLDAVTGFDPEGGAAGLGRAVARQTIDPRAWYFKAHFFEDPVQPGSLGLEAVLSLLKAAARLKGLAAGIEAPRFEAPALGEPLSWRYRGQVVPTNRQVTSEIEILAIETVRDSDGRLERLIRGRGALWVDGLKIYAVEDCALRIHAGGGIDVVDAP
ncbi:MAG: beta-ketoacyl synthase, partial [Pseudomonadota bacterium]